MGSKMRNPVAQRIACVFASLSTGDSGKGGVVDIVGRLKETDSELSTPTTSYMYKLCYKATRNGCVHAQQLHGKELSWVKFKKQTEIGELEPVLADFSHLWGGRAMASLRRDYVGQELKRSFPWM
jgi:hypothetical protein